jgi:hypothetical protein
MISRKNLAVCLVILAVAAGCTMLKRDRSTLALDLVYHSDTRGYFMPCG